MAKFLDAKVVLLYVDQPVFSATGLAPQLTLEEIQECYEGQLHREIELLISKGTVAVETMIREGLAWETINLEAAQLKAKWIIAGMRGSGETRRSFFGSTALSLAMHTDTPLIVVPEEACFTPPKTITLAGDIGYGSEVDITDPPEEFGIKCHSIMYIVRIIKKGMDDFLEKAVAANTGQMALQRIASFI